jgi:hypothetical protein
MQRNIQWILDRIVEKFIPAIGSFMASAFQRMLIVAEAENQSQLEDLALRYEAAGKPELAQRIREQAQQLTLDKPLPLADKLLQEFGAENPALFEASQPQPPLALPDRRAKLRKRPDDTPPDSDNGATP